MGNHLQIIDVSGLKSAQARYLDGFDIVTAVIYVLSMSSFDEVLSENDEITGKSQNALLEGLHVFGEYLGHKAFKNIPFILFLNKADVLAQKCEKIKTFLENKDNNQSNVIYFALFLFLFVCFVCFVFLYLQDFILSVTQNGCMYTQF